jgi:hypothetical protein
MKVRQESLGHMSSLDHPKVLVRRVGGSKVPVYTNFGEGATQGVHKSDESAAVVEKKQPDTIGSGFWARFFPSVLRRMTSSFFATNSDKIGERKDEESQENDDFETPVTN